MPTRNPDEVVQAQLDAFNAKDIEGLLATYAPDAEQYLLHGALLAKGHAAMRPRFMERFSEPDLYAELLSRSVVGHVVTDTERITRNFPEGVGTLDMLCVYEVVDGRIKRASFAMGAKVLGPAPKARTAQTIATVLRVKDLSKSLAFYCEKLGFEQEFMYDDFYSGIRIGECRLHLKRAHTASRDQAAFEAAEELDVNISVGDAQGLFAQLKTAGVEFSVPLRKMPYGIEFYVRDPDGYILGFVQAS